MGHVRPPAEQRAVGEIRTLILYRTDGLTQALFRTSQHTPAFIQRYNHSLNGVALRSRRFPQDTLGCLSRIILPLHDIYIIHSV